jgi:hypothetical protein
VALAIVLTAIAHSNAADPEAQVDKVFAKWSSSTPGCAVGVAVDGRPTLAKAYGMADLEHDVRNTPDTIFEAGSVSKQFTPVYADAFSVPQLGLVIFRRESGKVTALSVVQDRVWDLRFARR